MVKAINQVVDGYGDEDKISELNRVASQVHSDLEAEIHVFGNVARIEESEKLGPQAYACDDAGIKAFENTSYAYNWHQGRYYDGILEGRGSLTNPDGHYLIWFVKYGDLYLKWVQNESEEMKKSIEFERTLIHQRMSDAACKQNFLNLLTRIQISKNADIPK